MTVPPFDLCVTNHADKRHLIEFPESIRHLAFFEEELFTVVAPRLQIIRLRAVLDKSDFAILFIDQVTAYNRGYPPAV